MKKTLLTLLAFAAVGPVAAQVAAPVMPVGPMDGPSLTELDAAANGVKDNGEIFDGRPVIRHEGPLVILEEEKDIFLFKRMESPGERCHGGGGRIHDGGPNCYPLPPRMIRYYGDRQTVGVADKDAYVKAETKSGMLWGGLAGGVAGLILGFLAGPLVGLAVLAAGIAAGALIAKSSAQKEPRIFQRDVVKYQTESSR